MSRIGVNLRWGEMQANTPSERMRKIFKGVIVDVINCSIE